MKNDKKNKRTAFFDETVSCIIFRLFPVFIIQLLLTIPESAFSQTVVMKSPSQPINLYYQKSSLFVKAYFSDPDMFMDSGQKAHITAEISNQGAGKAYDVA